MIMQGMSQIREAYFISFRGEINQKNMEERENEMKQKKTGISEYYGAAEPPVRCGESHLSGLTEPPHFVY